MPDTPEDVVKEAREFIGVVGNCGIYPDHAKRHIASLCDEVDRLKRGDFTAEEFQNLCHNMDIQAGFDAFANGCEAYQEKLFGRCRKGTTT